MMMMMVYSIYYSSIYIYIYVCVCVCCCCCLSLLAAVPVCVLCGSKKDQWGRREERRTFYLSPGMFFGQHIDMPTKQREWGYVCTVYILSLSLLLPVCVLVAREKSRVEDVVDCVVSPGCISFSAAAPLLSLFSSLFFFPHLKYYYTLFTLSIYMPSIV